MTYPILVERSRGGYRATPLSLPEASATAATREEALRAVTEALRTRLATAEIVEVDLAAPHVSPLRETVGLLADDPDMAREISAAAYAARDAEGDDE